MPSLDRSTLQRSALTRFNSALDDSHVSFMYLRYLKRMALSGPDEEMYLEDIYLFSHALAIERRGLFDIGRAIGYFEPNSRFEQPGLDAKIIETYSQGPEKWPLWFSDYARTAELNLKFDCDELLSEVDTPSIISLFQSTLLLSYKFYDRLIFYLQRALQDTYSPLDETDIVVKTDELWAQFQYRDGDEVVGHTIKNVSRCVAGLIELTKLLSAFNDIFSPYLSTEIRRASTNKRVLIQATSNLLAWRLNLNDQRTNQRLKTVTELFWQVCRDEFAANLQSNVIFAEGPSRQILAKVFADWKSRSNAEVVIKTEKDDLRPSVRNQQTSSERQEK